MFFGWPKIFLHRSILLANVRNNCKRIVENCTIFGWKLHVENFRIFQLSNVVLKFLWTKLAWKIFYSVHCRRDQGDQCGSYCHIRAQMFFLTFDSLELTLVKCPNTAKFRYLLKNFRLYFAINYFNVDDTSISMTNAAFADVLVTECFIKTAFSVCLIEKWRTWQ